jgi:hypothetical protein
MASDLIRPVPSSRRELASPIRRFSDLVGVTRAFGELCHSDSVAGQAMNRYRGTQAEFQFSMVLPHTAHSKLLISRASIICSLRS